MRNITFSGGRFSIQKADDGILHEDPIANAILQKLRRFLDINEPQLVRFLVNTWRSQGNAITFKEIREAIMAGDLNEELLEDWRQDYVRFVKKYLQPEWQKAIDAGAEEYRKKYPEWYFNPMAEGIKEWTATHSAEFVTSVTDAQIKGLRAVVQNAAVLNHLNVDELSRVIRPMVGLYAAQAKSNLNYYSSLIANGVSEKRAKDLSIRYSARQVRYRGYLIARQELAMAYNTGAHEAVKQAQAAGYMGKMVKISSCAMDERTCDTCRSLEGAIVGMDADFDVPVRGNYKFTRRHPPYHIGCRCGVMYREIEPPV